MLNILRSTLGSDFTAFHTALNAAKPSKAARKAIYEAIRDMPAVADAKAFANAFAADSKFAKGIADDLDLIDVWKGVKHLTTYRGEIDFLFWLKKAQNSKT